eukprot:TRINITY_DN4158_c0_g1_i1.p1 TRINITY_DN4158_c0_g1~~TRINITY_DN4158_c0_g1_i1.p1  ORF type:complete len:512 (-),score=125.47 TRINITY_DN4158_c0_g1_i1:333-1868(-)
MEDLEAQRLQNKPITVDAAKRNLDAVREALRHLGGKAFGSSIVDYLVRQRSDMLRSFGGDKKRLRYCVNGLLSARVNSAYFEKKVYKENGSTKTEWMLAELLDENSNNFDHHMKRNEYLDHSDRSLSYSEDDDTEKEDLQDDGSGSDTNANPTGMEEDGTPNSRRRRSMRQAENALRPRRNGSHRYSPDGVGLLESVSRESPRVVRRSRSLSQRGESDEDEDCFDSIHAIADAAFEENKETGDQDRNPIGEEPSDEFDNSEGDFQTGGNTPLTYRGMIKVALENMGGYGTFESISKFIGVRFKDQLVNKAETWKHSIAGCLSVYFARKEEKDASGKVIWTLEEPPKPKRRGRKRERDELISYNNERERERDTYAKETRSSAAKRRKDEMVLVSIEQLEALEEENECLKLLNVKKREEKFACIHADDFSNNNALCACCHERKELSMMLNPCGHIFCGSIFCDASTSKNCKICKAEVLQRLPHGVRNSKSLKGIFDSLANAVMTSDLNVAVVV